MRTILTPKQKGNLTEMLCYVEFMKLGVKISLPFGEDCRYDFIADINGKLIRVQCKSSHKLDNQQGFVFKCESVVSTTSRITTYKYNKDDIDYFATIDDGQCYLVPVQECGCTKTLRYCYPANGQKKNICLAENYKLKEMLEQIK